MIKEKITGTFPVIKKEDAPRQPRFHTPRSSNLVPFSIKFNVISSKLTKCTTQQFVHRSLWKEITENKISYRFHIQMISNIPLYIS